MKHLFWNLDDICTQKKFPQLVKEVRKELIELQKKLTGLDPSMSEESFKKLILSLDGLQRKLSRAGYLPSLMEATDQKSPVAQTFKSKVKDLEIQYDDTLRKFWHWVMGKEGEVAKLNEKNAKRLFAVIPDMTYFLDHMRKGAHYVLSNAEESIISKKDANGSSVLKDLRDLLETEFSYVLKVKGKKDKVIRTGSELRAYVYSPNAEERKAAYYALLTKQKENIEKFFIIYQAIAKDWAIEAKLRGYPQSISMRNFANHVPDDAIDTLLKVCQQKRTIFHRYFRYKAKQLKMKKLQRFDIYAPLELKNTKIPFEDAVELVLETLKDFHPGFHTRAKQIVNENHVHSPPLPTKRGGAFCATVEPALSPYVLLNYTGKLRDVSTLAHELGHGVHSLYAQEHLSFTQHANLPLAETASTFSEMILFEKLFSQEKDRKKQQAMLADKLSDSFATILRQCYFVIFEQRAHEALQKGLNAEDLSRLYFDTLKEQFGDSVEIDPLFAYEWSTIPHIVHTPFYCYAYCFGELLSLSLFARYKNEGKSFLPKIEQVLMAGGSQDPQKVLLAIGVNITAKDFWEGGFSLLEEMQERLEKLG